MLPAHHISNAFISCFLFSFLFACVRVVVRIPASLTHCCFMTGVCTQFHHYHLSIDHYVLLIHLREPQTVVDDDVDVSVVDTASCQPSCHPSHGTCISGRCKCNQGWTGSTCDLLQCDQTCLLHGVCLEGTCLCNYGWNGNLCSFGKLLSKTPFKFKIAILNFFWKYLKKKFSYLKNCKTSFLFLSKSCYHNQNELYLHSHLLYPDASSFQRVVRMTAVATANVYKIPATTGFADVQTVGKVLAAVLQLKHNATTGETTIMVIQFALTVFPLYKY